LKILIVVVEIYGTRFARMVIAVLLKKALKIAMLFQVFVLISLHIVIIMFKRFKHC